MLHACTYDCVFGSAEKAVAIFYTMSILQFTIFCCRRPFVFHSWSSIFFPIVLLPHVTRPDGDIIWFQIECYLLFVYSSKREVHTTSLTAFCINLFSFFFSVVTVLRVVIVGLTMSDQNHLVSDESGETSPSPGFQNAAFQCSSVSVQY